jgi:hypothetical protein
VTGIHSWALIQKEAAMIPIRHDLYSGLGPGEIQKQ